MASIDALAHVGGSSNHPTNSESQADNSDIVARTPRRRDTALSGIMVRRGPGLTMLQLARFGGEVVERIADFSIFKFRGPNHLMLQIGNYFGHDDMRQVALDELHAKRDRLPKRHALREHCHKLLKYALPQCVSWFPGVLEVLFR